MSWGYAGWGAVRWAAGNGANAGVSYTPGQAIVTFTGQAPGSVSYQFPADRVSWIGLEAMHAGVAKAKASWIGLEVMRTTATVPTGAVVSWIGVEAMHRGVAAALVTWIGVEVLRSILSVSNDSNYTSIIW
jgi:uncharacterized membrane protein (DUF441 family)